MTYPMDKNTRTDAGCLRVAADYLNTKGWIKGQLGGINRPACLVGALREAVAYQLRDGAVVFDHARLNRLREACIETLGPASSAPEYTNAFAGGCSLSLWNDAIQRTKDEVLALLRTTADNIEAKERAKCAEEAEKTNDKNKDNEEP